MTLARRKRGPAPAAAAAGTTTTTRRRQPVSSRVALPKRGPAGPAGTTTTTTRRVALPLKSPPPPLLMTMIERTALPHPKGHLESYLASAAVDTILQELVYQIPCRAIVRIKKRWPTAT